MQKLVAENGEVFLIHRDACKLSTVLDRFSGGMFISTVDL